MKCVFKKKKELSENLMDFVKQIKNKNKDLKFIRADNVGENIDLRNDLKRNEEKFLPVKLEFTDP